MPISKSDALRIHKAVHGTVDSVTLTSGDVVPVKMNPSKCRCVEVDGIKGMEQNKTKGSDWAKKAKAGSKITWFLGANPWGRIVDGVVEQLGGAISDAKAAEPPKKKPAAAEAADPPSTKKAKLAVKETDVDEAAEEPPAKKAKPAVPAASAASGSAGPLQLAALFTGSGHGKEWQKILAPVIEGLPEAAKFIGPGRDKRIVPVRELTFQALKPNPPSGWKVVSLGQSPFPRVESATGIAHFDSAVDSWESKRFGACVTMRCLIKAAAMAKFKIPKATAVPDLREVLRDKRCVGPAEWFQAMLTQGVLFMNAACTLLPEPGTRAGEVVLEHTKFWEPVMWAVVDSILSACRKEGRGVVFTWWGGESLKVKKALISRCTSQYPDVKVAHVDHKNPAAQGDAFCDEPNVFERINQALGKMGLGKIDWLPNSDWKAKLGKSSEALAEQMGDFITETQELHKMYLERLRDGLDKRDDDLQDITGVMSQSLVSLVEACEPLKLEAAAQASEKTASKLKRGSLTVNEAAAVHLYTTNSLYKMLNEALRNADRGKVERYFLYLRLLITALQKLPKKSGKLYRGVALDLASQYRPESRVTWWAVSSCTPSLQVANSFGGGGKQTLFVVSPKSGVCIRELSQFRDEEEVVLPPGTQFDVTKVEKKGNLTEVHLKEHDAEKRVR